MKDYLVKNELESIYQAGYKENNSCETMLLTLYDKLYHDYDTDKAQILIALDYSAAFDCLNQDQLVEVLNEEFGVEQDALKVLHSYFKERRYTIEINQHKSKEQKLTIGSGQGSVMSSMGFSLDVNQLSIIPKKHEQDAYQYADDVSIRFSFDENEDFEKVSNTIVNCLNDILEFSMIRGLALNSKKTQGLIIAKQAIREKWKDLKINFDGKNISFNDDMEILGAIITHDLKQDAFVARRVSKCIKSLATLKKLNVKSKEIRHNLAVTLALSKIDYCNALLSGSTNKLYEEYQKAIRSVVRYVCGLRRRDPTSKHMNNLHILNAKHRVTYKVCNITWKIITMNEPKMLANIMPTNKADPRLRSNKDIYKINKNPKLPTGMTNKRFTFAAEAFNKLPKHIREIQNAENFKKHLKTHLFNEQLTSHT